MHIVTIELSEVSKKRLALLFEKAHETWYGGHLTVAFKPDPEMAKYLGALIGTEAKLTAIGHVADERGQAVVIREQLRHDPGTPHITLSCALGTTPKYSNEMIQKLWVDSKVRDGSVFDLKVPLELTGTYTAK